MLTVTVTPESDDIGEYISNKNSLKFHLSTCKNPPADKIVFILAPVKKPSIENLIHVVTAIPKFEREDLYWPYLS